MENPCKIAQSSTFSAQDAKTEAILARKATLRR
jgi:hypothetical protein